MTMGVGAALTEELAVDTRFGFFVSHDLASYEVPVHTDIPHHGVIFLDEVDPTVSPTKVKGVGELGLSGVSAAVANAVYNATGARVKATQSPRTSILGRCHRSPSSTAYAGYRHRGWRAASRNAATSSEKAGGSWRRSG